MTLVMLATAVVYIYAYPYSESLNNPNENVRLYMTRSIVEQGTFAIDAIIDEWGYVNDKATFEGRMYPGKAPGVSYLGVPVWWVYHNVASHVGYQPTRQEVVLVCRLGACVLPALAFLALFGRFTRRATDDTSIRVIGFCAMALGSTMLTYGGMFASHTLMAGSLFAAYMLAVLHREEPDGPWTPVGVGFLLAAAVAMEYPAALGAAVVGLYSIAISPRRARFVILSALGTTIPMALVVLFHWRAFGGPLSTPYANLENPEFVIHMSGFYGMERLRSSAFYGSFFAPSNGLFWYMPWTALSVLSLPLALRHPRLREPALVTIGVLLAYMFFITTLHNWRGGWTAGPRYIVAVVPFLAWYLLMVLSELRHTRGGLPMYCAALGAVAVAMFNCGIAAATFPHYPEPVNNPIHELSLHLLCGGYTPHNPMLFG